MSRRLCCQMGDAAALVQEWRTACASNELAKSPAVLKVGGCCGPVCSHALDHVPRELTQGGSCSLLQAFLYDRCEAWTELLGLHIGAVTHIEHHLNKCVRCGSPTVV